MKTDSTLLDYTRSAEEICKFKLKEKCHEIASKYEKFNIENRVYEKFGEYLLERAKNSYSLGFDSGDLKKILTEVEYPEQNKIDAMREDYFWCKELREICPDEWCFKMCYRSSYEWYTLWRIAKAYNGNYGCVVKISPSEKYNKFWFVLDWSQDANDCISKEKWRSEAKKEIDKFSCLLIGAFTDLLCTLFLFCSFEFKEIFFVWLVSVILLPIIERILIESFVVRKGMNVLSKPFQEHCERINQTRYSEFDIEKG